MGEQRQVEAGPGKSGEDEDDNEAVTGSRPRHFPTEDEARTIVLGRQRDEYRSFALDKEGNRGR